jgi:glycerol-3-phosphate dehydrogenase
VYDHLGGRKILPATSTLDLSSGVEGAVLNDRFTKAYEYSDCWVEDSRLVVLNARDAQARGADIMVRTKVTGALRSDDHWTVTLEDGEGASEVTAKMIVNAAGPWVGDVLNGTLGLNSREGVRLVRGSHIVVPKLYEHDKCYFFQGEDGRIIFAIPYENDFTLIGTTDADHSDPSQKPECTPEEQDYLCAFASNYFAKPVTRDEIVWTYSGVRPLYDDGADNASAATRDYTLKLDDTAAPLLNIFGGKITTYRRLAESALAKISTQFEGLSGNWTAGVSMPGGDFPVDGVPALIAKLQASYPFLNEPWARRLVRAYGTDAAGILADAKTLDDLGEDLGASITARELDWLKAHEFARTGEDVLWRRSKLGLRLTPAQVARINAYMTA